MEQFPAPNPADRRPPGGPPPHVVHPPSVAFAAPDSAALQQPPPSPAAMVPVVAPAPSSKRPRRGILVAGMGAMAVAAVAAGAFVITRDNGEKDVVEDATELATDSKAESAVGYSFAAATATAQAAASVVFDMEIDSPDGPMSATAAFDRTSGRLAMDLDMSQLVAEDELFEFGDSLGFIVDEQDQLAYVGADFFAALFGSTDANWISLTSDEFSIDDDVFGDVFTNPLNIADVFGDIEPIDLGDETIDGEVLRHFEVTLDDEAIAKLADNGTVAKDPAQTDFDDTYDVWVDESSQIRRILFDAVDNGQVGSVDMWITISGDPIDITLPAPNEVVDIEELFATAFEDLGVDENLEFNTEED
jgi:hypothetical protein